MFQLNVHVTGRNGLPLVGGDVTFPLLSNEGTKFVESSGKVLVDSADDNGNCSVLLQSSSLSGMTDKLEIDAGGISRLLNIETAAQGVSASNSISPATQAVGQNSATAINVQLLGRYNEPLSIGGKILTAWVNGQGTLDKSSAVTDANGRASFMLRTKAPLFSQMSVSVRDNEGIADTSGSMVVAPPMRSDVIGIGENGYFLQLVISIT